MSEGSFSAKMYANTKELGPVWGQEGGPRDGSPLGSTNACCRLLEIKDNK